MTPRTLIAFGLARLAEPRCLFWVSIGLYAACLPLDAFCFYRSCWVGISVVLFGGLGALFEPFVDFAWLANPLLFFAWYALWRGHGAAAQGCAVAALLLAGSFPVIGTVMTNEGGVVAVISRVAIGYWAWLASIVTAALAGRMLVVDARLSRMGS